MNNKHITHIICLYIVIYIGKLTRKDEVRYSKTAPVIRAACVTIVKWNKTNDIDSHDKVSIA